MKKIIITRQREEHVSYSYLHLLVAQDDYCRWPEVDRGDNRSEEFMEHLALANNVESELLKLVQFKNGQVVLIGGDCQAAAFWVTIRREGSKGEFRGIMKPLSMAVLPETGMVSVPEQLFKYVGSLHLPGWMQAEVVLTQPFNSGSGSGSGLVNNIGDGEYIDAYLYLPKDPGAPYLILEFSMGPFLSDGLPRLPGLVVEYDWIREYL